MYTYIQHEQEIKYEFYSDWLHFNNKTAVLDDGSFPNDVRFSSDLQMKWREIRRKQADKENEFEHRSELMTDGTNGRLIVIRAWKGL